DAAPPAQAATAGGDPTAVAQRTYPTDAFKIRLPADWKPKCIEEQGTCAGQALQGDQYRSAWSKGGGSSALTLVIDRTPLGDSISHVSLSELVGGVDDTFATSLPGYERGKLSKAPKGARTFSFTSEANPPAGTVFVFKHEQDVYVITGTGPDPGSARAAAQLAIESLKPA
ncbi:MAG TPA: hypothetical protein VFG79_19165, partial [Solirubrobacter sp.]|nr:hypothetical protein [Solirubrobacter sp.]